MKKNRVSRTIWSRIKDRQNIVLLEKLYEKVTPNFLKESRFFSSILFKYLIGPWFDVDFKQKYKKFRDKDWVELYDSLYINRIRNEDVTENQKKFILKNIIGKRLVDVGCGTGYFCRDIKRKISYLKITGCDLSPVAIADNKRRFRRTKGLTFKTEDITKLSFMNEQFDTVICCHVIEHIVDFKKSISELVRVSKSRTIIIVPEERFKKYSPDYHINYFNRDNMIENFAPTNTSVAFSTLVDGDRCIILDRK